MRRRRSPLNVWKQVRRHPRGGLWLALVVALCAAVTAAVAHASARVALQPDTTNPYTGASGAPDCTWYAWQRLHDTLHVDMQPTGNAGQWAALAQVPNAFWWEDQQIYVPAQVRPDLTSTPTAGDVVVFPDPAAGWAYPSHVAFVEQVTGDLFLISEQSYQDFAPGPKTTPYPYVNHRWVSLAAMRQAEPRGSFIHFGAPVGDDAAPVSQSRSPTVEPGQRFTISVTERNTGFHSWSDADGFDLACVSNCMGATSAGFAGARVAPGQAFQFKIALTAPTTPGVYASRWEMRQGSTAFGNMGISMAVNVADDQSQAQAQSQVLEAQPGQVLMTSFTFTNTGKTTWTRADGYTVACDAAISADARCPQGAALGLFSQQKIAPGQAFKSIVLVVAPSAPGTYVSSWDMQHDGIAFGAGVGSLQIVVGQFATGNSAWQHRSIR